LPIRGGGIAGNFPQSEPGMSNERSEKKASTGGGKQKGGVATPEVRLSFRERGMWQVVKGEGGESDLQKTEGKKKTGRARFLGKEKSKPFPEPMKTSH